MHAQMVHNGRLRPVENCLSPGQYGLLSGWGVFSTLRIYEGVPFAYEWHWERMARDAGRLRIKFDFDADEIRGHLLRLIEANHALEAAARMYFVRNQGGIWSAASDAETDYLLFTADIKPWPASSRLSVAAQARHAASPLAGVKVLSWVGNVATLEEAQQRGFDEVVLLNERDEVSECTAANIFIVRGGWLITPPLDSGCLPGVTRRAIIETLRGTELAVREDAFTLDDLRIAEEVFISSTTREVMPVREVEGARFPESGPVTARVRDALRTYIRDYVNAAKRYHEKTVMSDE